MTRHVPRRRLAALAVLAALGMTACGGGDGGGGGTPGPAGGADKRQDDGQAKPAEGEEFDGCELVGRTEAETILGESVTQGDESAQQFAVATCVWEVDRETSFKLLQFSVYRGEQFYGGELFKDDPNFEKVEGVGDDAFFVEPLGVQLQILVGDYSVLIDVSGFNEEPPLDKAKVKEQLIALGKKVASELS